MDLASKVVLLTGARRIGHTIAVACAGRGADLVLAYRSSAGDAEATAAEVMSAGRRALVVQADVSDPASCEALIANVERSFGRLDVLVNMASFYQAVIFDELDVEKWDHQLAIDLRGAFLCAKAAVPVMRKVGGGRIINFSDWVAASNRPRYKGYVAYYVAKAGVKALTEALALELAIDGILVNAIATSAPRVATAAATTAPMRRAPVSSTTRLFRSIRLHSLRPSQTRPPGITRGDIPLPTSVHRVIAGAGDCEEHHHAGEHDRILDAVSAARFTDPVEKQSPLPVHLPHADDDVDEVGAGGPAREPADADQNAAEELREAGHHGQRERRR